MEGKGAAPQAQKGDKLLEEVNVNFSRAARTEVSRETIFIVIICFVLVVIGSTSIASIRGEDFPESAGRYLIWILVSNTCAILYLTVRLWQENRR
jgi:hypothetical protein